MNKTVQRIVVYLLVALTAFGMFPAALATNIGPEDITTDGKQKSGHHKSDAHHGNILFEWRGWKNRFIPSNGEINRSINRISTVILNSFASIHKTVSLF